MPTLLQINATANWGSTGKIAELCNQYAAKQGWEIYAAYGRYRTPGQSKLINTTTKWDVYEHYAEFILFDNEGLASRNATNRLVEVIQRINPDIVHLHNLHDHWLNFRVLFEYLNQTTIKVVWTFHDLWSVTGHCSNVAYMNCDKYMDKCVVCPMTKGRLLPLFKQTRRNFQMKKQLFSANKNLHVVSVSEWVDKTIAKSFLKEKDRRVIYNGIDTDIFKPTELGILNTPDYAGVLSAIAGKFVIMAVSSQWKSNAKGLDDYKAMVQMLNKDEVIVLVGVSEDISKDFPSNMIAIRRTDNQRQLAALYSRADVVCSFSYAETFGLTIVEGYACGTPAVVYDNTALPDLITEESGYVVENKNYTQAYSAIQQIKLDGKHKYSDACIRVAREKYNQAKCFEEYIKLYESLI